MVDISIRSSPSDAAVELRTAAVALPGTTTDAVLKNIYRGKYLVRVTKPQYRPAMFTLNLVSDGELGVECTLGSRMPPMPESSCRRRLGPWTFKRQAPTLLTRKWARYVVGFFVERSLGSACSSEC